jgi:hypothetical protein
LHADTPNGYNAAKEIPMSIQLTPQQQQELDARAGDLPRVLGARADAVYVLLPESDYETLRQGREDRRRPLAPDAKTIFLKWERLRLVYNAILIGLVLCSGRLVGILEDPVRVIHLLGDAVIANVCFCAGPVAEWYLCWLGLNRRLARWGTFLLGTCLAVSGAVLEMERLATFTT